MSTSSEFLMILNDGQCSQITKVVQDTVTENQTIQESFPIDLITRVSRVAAHHVTVKRLPSAITERFVANCRNCEVCIILTVSKFPMSTKRFYDYFYNSNRSFSLVLETGFIRELAFCDGGSGKSSGPESNYLIPICKKLEAFF